MITSKAHWVCPAASRQTSTGRHRVAGRDRFLTIVSSVENVCDHSKFLQSKGDREAHFHTPFSLWCLSVRSSPFLARGIYSHRKLGSNFHKTSATASSSCSRLPCSAFFNPHNQLSARSQNSSPTTSGSTSQILAPVRRREAPRTLYSGTQTR